MTGTGGAEPRNYITHPVRATLGLDLTESDLRHVLYLALRTQEAGVHNGERRGKAPEEMTAAEVHELIRAEIRAAAYRVIEAGANLAERDAIALPTVAAWCATTAAQLVHTHYGEPSDDPKARGIRR